MPGQTEMSRSRLARRLGIFYAIIAVIGVAVVIFVVNKGGNEKAQPSIAGGYTLAAASPCIGPVPKPGRGHPAPADRADAGGGRGAVVQRPPVRAVRQLHQQPEHARRPAAARRQDAPRQRAPPDRRPSNCVSGGNSLHLDAIATPGAKAAITGTLGGAPFAANFSSAPPAPGAAAPRTPKNIQGTYALSPASTCFGSSFSIHGTGSVAQLYSSSEQAARTGHLLDQDRRRVRRRQVRQGRRRAPDRDRQRPPAPEGHGDPAQRGHAGPVDGLAGQAGADHPVGPVAGRREVHRDQAAG